jgi:hypothetical protein
MSTCRWTGRPRSEWSASIRPIAPIIGPPAHFYVRDIGKPGSPRPLAEAIAKPNQPVPARRETFAQLRMTTIFVPLWFGWALKTGHKGGHFALSPGDCRDSRTRWRSGVDSIRPKLETCSVEARRLLREQLPWASSRKSSNVRDTMISGTRATLIFRIDQVLPPEYRPARGRANCCGSDETSLARQQRVMDLSSGQAEQLYRLFAK